VNAAKTNVVILSEAKNLRPFTSCLFHLLTLSCSLKEEILRTKVLRMTDKSNNIALAKNLYTYLHISFNLNKVLKILN